MRQVKLHNLDSIAFNLRLQFGIFFSIFLGHGFFTRLIQFHKIFFLLTFKLFLEIDPILVKIQAICFLNRLNLLIRGLSFSVLWLIRSLFLQGQLPYLLKLIRQLLILLDALTCCRIWLLFLVWLERRLLLTNVYFEEEVVKWLVKSFLFGEFRLSNRPVVLMAWCHLLGGQHGNGIELSRLSEVDRVTVCEVIIDDFFDLFVITFTHILWVFRRSLLIWWCFHLDIIRRNNISMIKACLDSL